MSESYPVQQALFSLETAQYQRAITLFEQCIQAKPDEISNYWYCGLAMLLAGEPEIASVNWWLSVITHADPGEITQLVTELLQILKSTAQKLAELGEFSQAEKIYHQIIEITPHQGESFLILGTILFKQHKFTEAIPYFSQALELHYNPTVAHYNLGVCHFDLQQFETAVNHFTEVIKLKPTFAEPYYYLGVCFQTLYQPDPAIDYFQKAIEFKTKFITVYQNLALCLMAEKRSEEAVLAFQKALEVQPESSEAYYNYADCLKSIGRVNEAIENLQKAIEINPNYLYAYYNLGRYLRDQGNIQAALQSFQKALDLNPEFTAAADFITELSRTLKAGYIPQLEQGYKAWDAMLFRDENFYRLFYLTGEGHIIPHWTIGEVAAATSTDLQHWNYQGIVLKSSPDPHWASGRILAGSLYKEKGTYYFFYAAAPPKYQILEERIGLATSTDGIYWQHQLQPFLEADPRFYGTLSYPLYGTQVKHIPWRDPYIVQEPQSGKYYMFIAACYPGENSSFRGCIGLAVADQLDGPYEILPPAAYPMEGDEGTSFYEMERPQVIYKYGQYHLFFCVGVRNIHPAWIEKIGRDKITDSTLFWYVSDQITGPFKPHPKHPVVKGSEKTGLYGTNFIETFEGQWIAIGHYYFSFTLEVSPRFQVQWNEDKIEILV